MCAASRSDLWVSGCSRFAQGAQFQARRLADFFPVQFDRGVVEPGFPEAFEPGLPGAEPFDGVVEPTGVPRRRW